MAKKVLKECPESTKDLLNLPEGSIVVAADKFEKTEGGEFVVASTAPLLEGPEVILDLDEGK